MTHMPKFVALRKESVDRNLKNVGRSSGVTLVALRKESVDRNVQALRLIAYQSGSLSARRAWIEIRSREEARDVSVRRSPQGERG